MPSDGVIQAFIIAAGGVLAAYVTIRYKRINKPKNTSYVDELMNHYVKVIKSQTSEIKRLEEENDMLWRRVNK